MMDLKDYTIKSLFIQRLILLYNHYSEVNVMEDIKNVFRQVIEGGGLKKIVFGKMRRKSDDLKRVEIRPVTVEGEKVFQVSCSYEKKVTHENLDDTAAILKCSELVENNFKQVNIFTTDEDIQILANKPSKPRIMRSCASKKAEDTSHDRKKNYIIPEGTPCDFLVHLGVMDENGKVYKKYYSKFRQINRFLEIVDDVSSSLIEESETEAISSSAENGDFSVSSSDNVKDTAKAVKPLKIIDFGCGKAYLTFALYHYFVKLKKIPCRITGLDLKEDVIRFCEKTARQLGYDGLVFETGDIADYSDDSADMVVTLHACDTATDYALINAVKWNTKVILSVPCCQHELFRQIKNDINEPMLKHGIIKDKFTELLTDGLRGLKLEACGYDVSMMEFTSLEHTSKNIMIKAVLSTSPDSQKAIKAQHEYESLKKEYNVSPSIDAMK